VKKRILFVDDEFEVRDLVSKALARRGFDVDARGSANEALSSMQENPSDAVITDIHLDGTSGLELCQRINESHPDIPVIVVTGFGSMESAVGAMRAGAYDFIKKPIDMAQLLDKLDRAFQLRALRDEVKRLREGVDAPRAFEEIIGDSPAMNDVFELLERASNSETTVLVTGESGTGKELVAHALHKRSKRAAGPFVAINCAAVAENILESELFGHVAGSFTDAKRTRVGLLVAASGGTLFLDEIGEMPPAMQAKLLRALQERVVRPVGGSREIPFDVRIVAATNRDLETAVAKGQFRSDLYYRIDVVRVHMPPLRARGNDVLLLAQWFIGKFASESHKPVRGLSTETAERLLAYRWPGNVRELQNCIERAVALAQFDQITVLDLPEELNDHHTLPLVRPMKSPMANLTPLSSLHEHERSYILRVLRELKGDRALAAQVLGLDRRTLNRRIEGLEQEH